MSFLVWMVIGGGATYAVFRVAAGAGRSGGASIRQLLLMKIVAAVVIAFLLRSTGSSGYAVGVGITAMVVLLLNRPTSSNRSSSDSDNRASES